MTAARLLHHQHALNSHMQTDSCPVACRWGLCRDTGCSFVFVLCAYLHPVLNRIRFMLKNKTTPFMLLHFGALD